MPGDRPVLPLTLWQTTQDAAVNDKDNAAAYRAQLNEQSPCPKFVSSQQ
jgi:hypothetical protein